MNFKHKQLFIEFNSNSKFDNLEKNLTFVVSQTQPMTDYNTSNFYSFFKQLNVLVPETLVKTRSLLRLQGDNFFSVFTRYLSRHGSKNFSRKIILMSFLNFIRSSKLDTFIFWKKDLVNLFKVVEGKHGYLDKSLFSIKSDHMYPSLKSLCESSFEKFNFLFSFYIYKVDKHIYKNSRGRSGKFTFIWKYIAPYKRYSRISYWIMKELRISPGKTIQERLDNVLHTFLLKPRTSLVWKINKFSLTYSYFNLRSSLLETYRTSSR